MSKVATSPALFPPYVAQHSVSFEPEAATVLADEFPGISLPKSLEGAVRKRKAEFLAGRHCAREALRVCAPALAEVVIGHGKNREPLWPAGIVGAITHTHGFASAVIARATSAIGLGLDSEIIMPGDEAESVRNQIAVPGELDALMRATGWPLPLTLTVVFSAKETIFKCLYAQVGSYFDFQDAELVAVDPAGGTFSARLLTALAPALPRGYAIQGRFERDARSVCTGMVLPA